MRKLSNDNKDFLVDSNGDASVMENLLNNETRGECRKQVGEFMLKAYDLGYFSRGTSEIMKEMKKRKQSGDEEKSSFYGTTKKDDTTSSTSTSSTISSLT